MPWLYNELNYAGIGYQIESAGEFNRFNERKSGSNSKKESKRKERTTEQAMHNFDFRLITFWAKVVDKRQRKEEKQNIANKIFVINNWIE